MSTGTVARVARVALGVVGGGAAVLGIGLLLHLPGRQPVDAIAWLVGGVVAHDAVIAPLTLAVSAVGLRVLPARARGPVAAGFVVLGTVTLSAVPVLLSLGARPDNPTLLDRDYEGGWLILAAVVAAGVALTMVVRRPRAGVRGSAGEPGEEP